MDVIKGPLVSMMLATFGQIGFVLAKGKIKELSGTELYAVLGDLSLILPNFQKEPSFSKRYYEISNAISEAESIRRMIQNQISIGTDVIKGQEKRSLLDKLETWYNLMIDLVQHHIFSTLSEDSLEKLFPESITNKLKEPELKDLLESATCVVYGLPTPAAVTLFRIAENESRKYFKFVTGNNPPDRWYDLIEELKITKSTSNSLVSYMDFIRNKRNDAVHPGKRYSQDEAESILQQLSFLMKEIYS